MAERTFTCFGGACTVLVEGDGAADAVIAARDRLLAWHEVFTRFKPGSELSRLNGDPRECVPVSPMMARFAAAAVAAAEATGGLVDPTLLEEIEEAGYRSDRLRGTLALPMALALAPPRAVGGPHPAERWRTVEVDVDAGTVTRPPGVKLDGGGIVKGLCADVLAESLDGSFAINCEIAKRSWLGAGTRPAHHLLTPQPAGPPRGAPSGLLPSWPRRHRGGGEVAARSEGLVADEDRLKATCRYLQQVLFGGATGGVASEHLVLGERDERVPVSMVS